MNISSLSHTHTFHHALQSEIHSKQKTVFSVNKLFLAEKVAARGVGMEMYGKMKNEDVEAEKTG